MGGSLRSNVRAQILNALPKSRKNPEAKTHTLKLAKTWKKKNGVMLKLSNKMVLQCKKTKKQWKKGDLVSLEYDKGFELSNLTNYEKLKARVVKSKVKSVKALAIRKIADGGKKIVLSDGSTWLLYHLHKPWNIGDHIVASSMSMGIDMSSHQLLNLDALNKNKKKNCCHSAVLMK